MNQLRFLVIAWPLLLLIGCGDGAGNGEQMAGSSSLDDAKNIQFEGEVSADLGKQMNTLLASYIAVKDALVASDSISVTHLGRALAGSTALVDTALIKPDDKARWHNRKKQIIGYGLLLEGTPSLVEQRKAFQKLSIIIYEVLTDIGTSDKLVYRQYCPMAFNNNGGYWLSTEAEILNPYFGEKMLKCGKVEEVIEFK